MNWSTWEEFVDSLKPYLPEWPAYMITRLKDHEEALLFKDNPYPLRYSNREDRMRVDETWLVVALFKGEVVGVPIAVEAAKYPISMIDGRRGDHEHPGSQGFAARKWQALIAIQERTGIPKA